MKCNKCGNDLSLGTTFCPFCGNQTSESNLNPNGLNNYTNMTASNNQFLNEQASYNNLNNQMNQVNNVVNGNDNFNMNNQFQNNINNNTINNQQSSQMMNNQFGQQNTMNGAYNNQNSFSNNYTQEMNQTVQSQQTNNTNITDPNKPKKNNTFIIIVIILAVIIVSLILLVLNKNGILGSNKNNNDNDIVNNDNSSNSNTINDSNSTKINISGYQVTIPSGLYYNYLDEYDYYMFSNKIDFIYQYMIVNDSVDYYINSPSAMYSAFTQNGLSSINEETKTIDGVKTIIYTLKYTAGTSEFDSIYWYIAKITDYTVSCGFVYGYEGHNINSIMKYIGEMNKSAKTASSFADTDDNNNETILDKNIQFSSTRIEDFK